MARKRSLRVAAALVAVCLVSSATLAEGAGYRPDLSWVALVAAIVGTGGISALITLRSQRRRVNAEADNQEADALGKGSETIGRYIDQVNSLQQSCDAMREALHAAEERVLAAEEKAQRAIERCARVEEIAALAVAAGRMDNLREFADFFDQVPVPIAFTREGGTFEWVNLAFCRLLGRRKEEFLGLAWRNLLVPSDLEATTREESAATRRRVWGFKNRWISTDGQVVTLEWFVPSYKDGNTVALARPFVDGQVFISHRAPGRRAQEKR